MTGTDRNRWLRDAQSHSSGSWPLAYDLGRNTGSLPWWRNLGLVLVGPALALTLGLIAPGDAYTASRDRTEIIPRAAAADADTVIPQPEQAGITAHATYHPAAHPPLLAALSPAPEATDEAVSPPGSREVAHALRRNETLIEALINAGSDRRDAYAAANALARRIDARRLRPGMALTLALGRAGEPAALSSVSLRTGFDRLVIARRSDHEDRPAYTVEENTLPARRLLDRRAGVIEDSLYLAARRAGVPNDILIDMIRLFSFNVDFQRQIRPGDSFALVYDRRVTEVDGRIENGRILYARMTLRGEELAFYRFEDADGEAEYFDRNGKSARKALMKTPLDGARLTSHFGPRKHPVLGYVRAHQGVDFGAPTGTPVYAAGDGVVERASRYGSYGNYIRIRHNSTDYKTAYAHLSGYARGVRSGARVRQGQVIGYVGATGRVTGAHLHYEVYQGDRRVNPMRLDLPSGRSLEGAERDRFVQYADALDNDRTALAHATRVALVPTGGDVPIADAVSASAAP